MGFQSVFLSFLLLVGVICLSPAQAGEVTSVEAFNGETLTMSVLTYEQAEEFFQYVKKQKNIPFGLIADGCHVRAQQMSDLAHYKKIHAAKVIVEASAGTKLVIKSEDGPWQAAWDYHIAPVLMVSTAEGVVRPFIIDPALYDAPVSREQWLAKIFKDTEEVAKERADIYFVSRFTFSPGVKEVVYTELPQKLDRNMGGMLSVFSTNLKRMGSFYEKCFFKDPETQVETIGGLIKTMVPHHELYEKCQPAGI